ncbi:MAG TPA: T6SS immunity protein Tdi1 domain-containing protein [Steroidobacteraceae bacterium]|nr:T6SS immunity protein Tdi1 domain-containing protein [Steroidobacteraceae bacterium]
MSVSWSQLTCTPDRDAIVDLAAAWAWKLTEPFSPIVFSALGDMFYARDNGEIWWLNTGSGELKKVAKNVDEFKQLLATDMIDEWFLPPLIEATCNVGKVLQPGECYTYVTLPIFAEGRYEPDNLNPVRAREHFVLSGGIHKDLQTYPDGTKVKLSVVK